MCYMEQILYCQKEMEFTIFLDVLIMSLSPPLTQIVSLLLSAEGKCCALFHVVFVLWHRTRALRMTFSKMAALFQCTTKGICMEKLAIMALR